MGKFTEEPHHRTDGIAFLINSTILLSVEALLMKLFEDNLDVDSSDLWVELGRVAIEESSIIHSYVSERR